MYLLHYIRQMRGISKTEMSQILGCSRYRVSRLEAGENELYLDEWLSLLNWLKKSPVFNEEGFYMGDESRFLPKSAQVLGVLHFPLSTIFLRLLDDSFLQELPEVMGEFQIPESYFVNLANPLPGIVALRLLQKLASENKESSFERRGLNRATPFLELSVQHNFLDPDVLKFGDARQKGQHFCQQWSLTKMVDCRFNCTNDGLADIWVESRSDLLNHILFKDPVLSHLSVDYLEDIINAVVGEKLSLVRTAQDNKRLLHFQGWCRR